MSKIAFFVAMALLADGPAIASETVSYSYDALGRLTHVNHTGSVNNGLQAGYTYDPADNRLIVAVSGAPAALMRANAKALPSRKTAAPRKPTGSKKN